MKQPTIPLDEWVGNARPDPKKTETLVIMQGFIGVSSEDGHVRLYTDESLNNFVEIPQDGVVHSAPLSKEISPSGGSKLWIKADAVLVYGDPNTTSRPKKSFLEGEIMQQYVAAGFAAGQQQAARPLTPACGTPQCHTRDHRRSCLICASDLSCTIAQCPTQFLCTGFLCGNQLIGRTSSFQ